MNTPEKPALPTPDRARWQPLRLGLVELFHYDSEEFWFRDGHLLLRGNNGTGKSKVLSLTLPFLFDAQLKSSRIEPDGDPGKKMAWNLLIGRHDRRMGYAWIEFGRVSESGVAEYLTLGCGLFAATARPQVDSWFFVLEGQRIGEHLWLTSPQRMVLTRERLRDALESWGQVFDTAAAYRRAVDERLFHLGPARYAALMDTLIQLRQPQLSKKPDEASLSNALTEALPPMSTDLLTDVADALNQLEEYRRELEEYEALERAVGQFNQRYRIYASTQARRQARSLRSAQTGFDAASRTLNEGRVALASAQAAEALAQTAQGDAEIELAANRTRLEQADRDAQARQSEAEQAQRTRDDTQARLERERQGTHERSQRAASAGQALAEGRGTAQHCAERAGIASACESNPLIVLDATGLTALEPLAIETALKDLLHSVATRREQLALMQSRCDHVDQAEQAHARQEQAHGERQDEADEADLRVEQQGHTALSPCVRLHVASKKFFFRSTDVARSAASSAWRCALIASASQVASDRKNCSHCTSATCACYPRLGADQCRQCLGAVARQQQPGQIRSKTMALSQCLEQGIELHRKSLQVSPYRRTRKASRHATNHLGI